VQGLDKRKSLYYCYRRFFGQKLGRNNRWNVIIKSVSVIILYFHEKC
jgi:hypothetical protein